MVLLPQLPVPQPTPGRRSYYLQIHGQALRKTGAGSGASTREPAPVLLSGGEPGATSCRHKRMLPKKNLTTALSVCGSLLVLSGCAQSSASGTPAPSVSRKSVVTVRTAANGDTVQVHVGQQLRVVLGSATEAGSTYWAFADVTGPVVIQDGPQVVQAVPVGSAGCGSLPGAGCGTVTLVARAASPGTATITATRTTCGEAMMCPQNRRDFRVVLRVVP